MSNNPPSSKPVALIAGANKGIGHKIARQLGRDHGMTVLRVETALGGRLDVLVNNAGVSLEYVPPR